MVHFEYADKIEHEGNKVCAVSEIKKKKTTKNWLREREKKRAGAKRKQFIAIHACAQKQYDSL